MNLGTMRTSLMSTWYLVDDAFGVFGEDRHVADRSDGALGAASVVDAFGHVVAQIDEVASVVMHVPCTAAVDVQYDPFDRVTANGLG